MVYSLIEKICNKEVFRGMFFSPVAMHIPDGFLSLTVSLVYWLLAVLVIGAALRRVNRDLGERQVPLMGVLAAAIFAGQMLNFTVIGGTSGHLLGAALAAVVVGPWAAVLVMACVVGVQALIFQDGGLVVMGANLFNMAVVGVASAYVVFTLVRRLAGARRRGLIAGGFAAAWVSIVVSALSAGLQLSLSGTSPANLAIPAMAGIHALIGIGEGLITAGALAFLSAARPGLFEPEKTGRADRGMLLAGGLAAVLLAALSPLASSHPDGLEAVAERLGFHEAAREPLYSLIPDYLLPGVQNEALATVLAGVIGVFIVLGLWRLAGLRRQTQP